MGYLTVIEISHDYADRVKHAPIDFANAILELCRTGSARRPEVDQILASFGVVIGPTRHSSEPGIIRIAMGSPEAPKE